MKIGLIGSVKSSEVVLLYLMKHQFNIVGVLGFNPENKENVSGWTDLSKTAQKEGIPYSDYQKINDEHHIEWMKSKQPDVIFAVGFSQLLSKEWLDMPRLGCVGFHPTCLPKGRGRAPLSWLVLEENTAAASFFLMGEGADDGPLFVQETFNIDKDDDASSVGNKIGAAMVVALDTWLPKLKAGEWNPIPQDELQASWYGKRTPSDGVINWNMSAYSIDRLIKATSRPHPGAYTFLKDQKLIIWKSRIEKNIPIKGVVGRVLLCKEQDYLIQCGEDLLWISDIEGVASLRVGDKLGYNIEYEIYKIKNNL
ncbi:formyl transferase [Bacteroidia bacterium]|nr:formyl transferase [Bacteroidia bacterium]